MSSRTFAPGDSYGISFTIKNTSGALANADSLPVGAVYRNGTADGAVTVTVASSATGIYQATCTIPAGYALGDRVSMLITATVGGVATGDFVDHVRLDAQVNTRLATSGYTAPPSAASIALTLLGTSLNAPRALDAIADASLTVNDGFHCAIAAAAGKEDASSGTSMVIKTPSTGTTLRTFTIATSSTNPFGANFPVSRA